MEQKETPEWPSIKKKKQTKAKQPDHWTFKNDGLQTNENIFSILKHEERYSKYLLRGERQILLICCTQ